MAKSGYIKKCKKCGTEYVNFGFGVDKFCRSCGNKLPEPKKPNRCSKCKGIIRIQDKFCSSCGKEIKNKKEAKC
jgi:hypothetical protein